MSSSTKVIERGSWNGRTVLELVDPSDDIKVRGTFRWGAANCQVRIRGIAPQHIRPSHPDNVVVLVELTH